MKQSLSDGMAPPSDGFADLGYGLGYPYFLTLCASSLIILEEY